MPKQRVHKADKKAKKQEELSRERQVEQMVKEAEAKSGKTPLEQLNIRPEDRHLLDDFKGPKPKPSKPKPRYSGMAPPLPPPPLLDLMHNFLKDFNYIKAAHGIRTDNQKRPGHNMSIWKWTSNGMPDLIEIFTQWQKQNPGRSTALTVDDPTPKRTPGMALGIFGTEGKALSPQKPLKDKKKAKAARKDNSDWSEGISDGDSDDDMWEAQDENEAVGFKAPALAPVAKTLKRKAAEISDSSPSTSDSEESSEGTTSASSSGSDPEADAESALPSKKRKFGEALAPAPKRPARTVESESSEESSGGEIGSDSESESESDNGAGVSLKVTPQTAIIGATKQPASSGSEDDSESGSESSSQSSSSSSDSESIPREEDESTTAPAATSAQLASSRNDITNSGSDTSATLPLPANNAGSSSISNLPRNQTKGDISSSSSSSSSDEEDARGSRMQTEVLLYKKPLKKAKASKLNSDATEDVAVPANSKNIERLKKQNIPFSRIPSNIEVEEKFASNKYMPYDYADRAHEDLIVTKGKGFTKEKNKKKRGSYRGGVIDVTGKKGIKFDD